MPASSRSRPGRERSRRNTSRVRWRSRYSSMSRLTKHPARAAAAYRGRSRRTAWSTASACPQAERWPNTAETLMETWSTPSSSSSRRVRASRCCAWSSPRTASPRRFRLRRAPPRRSRRRVRGSGPPTSTTRSPTRALNARRATGRAARGAAAAPRRARASGVGRRSGGAAASLASAAAATRGSSGLMTSSTKARVKSSPPGCASASPSSRADGGSGRSRQVWAHRRAVAAAEETSSGAGVTAMCPSSSRLVDAAGHHPNG